MREARDAVRDFQSTKADFADALPGRANRTVGAKHTATFDRDLKSLDTVKLVRLLARMRLRPREHERGGVRPPAAHRAGMGDACPLWTTAVNQRTHSPRIS
jgi:hypothetical protein